MQQSSDTAPGCYTLHEKGLDMRNELNYVNTRTERVIRPTMPSGFVSPLQRSLSLYWAKDQYQTVPQLSIVTAETLTQEPWSVWPQKLGSRRQTELILILVKRDSFLLQPLKVDLIQQTRPLVVSVNNLVLGLESGLVSMRCQQLCERWDSPSCGCGTDAFKTRVAASGASVFAHPR